MSLVALNQSVIDQLDKAFRGVAGRKEIIRKEDIKTTENFLKAYLPMLRIVKDYEAAIECGPLLSNEPDAIMHIIDRGASDAYKSYKSITDFILATINNLYNPYERMIMQKLYIEGKSYKDAVSYMDFGYSGDLYPIGATTFAERRRKAINRIALSLKIIGILENMPDEVLKFGKENKKYKVPLRKTSKK